MQDKKSVTHMYNTEEREEKI